MANTNIQDMYITSIATDSDGNVYIAWLGGRGHARGNGGTGLPYLTISRDHGSKWSKPMMIASPGVGEARHEGVTATRLFVISDAFAPGGDAWAAFHCA